MVKLELIRIRDSFFLSIYERWIRIHIDKRAGTGYEAIIELQLNLDPGPDLFPDNIGPESIMLMS